MLPRVMSVGDFIILEVFLGSGAGDRDHLGDGDPQ